MTTALMRIKSFAAHIARGALAVTFAVAACSDATGPSEEPEQPRPRINVTEIQLSQSMLVMDDVSVRLLPSIANLPGTLELGAAAASLAQSVQARDAQGVIDNLVRARAALATVRRNTTDEHTADLDAIELAFRDAELLITFPSG